MTWAHHSWWQLTCRSLFTTTNNNTTNPSQIASAQLSIKEQPMTPATNKPRPQASTPIHTDLVITTDPLTRMLNTQDEPISPSCEEPYDGAQHEDTASLSCGPSEQFNDCARSKPFTDDLTVRPSNASGMPLPPATGITPSGNTINFRASFA